MRLLVKQVECTQEGQILAFVFLIWHQARQLKHRGFFCNWVVWSSFPRVGDPQPRDPKNLLLMVVPWQFLIRNRNNTFHLPPKSRKEYWLSYFHTLPWERTEQLQFQCGKEMQPKKIGSRQGQMPQLSNTESHQVIEYFLNTIQINNSVILLLMQKMVTIFAT